MHCDTMAVGLITEMATKLLTGPDAYSMDVLDQSEAAWDFMILLRIAHTLKLVSYF